MAASDYCIAIDDLRVSDRLERLLRQLEGLPGKGGPLKEDVIDLASGQYLANDALY